MSLPADVPIVLLVGGAAVLLASTALLTHTLPTLRRPRWLRRRSNGRQRQRLAITGRSPALPTGPIPAVSRPRVLPPARQDAAGRDVPERSAGLADAEAIIEHLLETDPEYLARTMMLWIRDDDADGPRR